MMDDFHYHATAVLARAAGFEEESSLRIAYACQYVDDATESRPLRIIIGGAQNPQATVFFDPACSSYYGIRSHHLKTQRSVYIPFHFLPPESTQGFSRYLTLPDSKFSRQILSESVKEKDPRFCEIRIGIAAHTFSDCYAHQGFSGRLHFENSITHVEQYSSGSWSKVHLKTAMLSALPQIGHLQAARLPDLPYARWRYQTHSGLRVERNNPDIYLEAAEKLFNFFSSVKKGKKKPIFKWKELSPRFERIFQTVEPRLKTRFALWNEEFSGLFSEKLQYDKLKWRKKALNVDRSELNWDQKPRRLFFQMHTYYSDENFFESDWALFHKAAILQRDFVQEKLFEKKY